MVKRMKFAEGEIYHICNKSIAGYGIFKIHSNAKRFIQTLDYYNQQSISLRFSVAQEKPLYSFSNLLAPKENNLVKFLAYVIMPDHYHILIKALSDNIISHYIGKVENSYARFFNIKFERHGPLWQSRFRAVRMTSNEQLLHVTRYIHLNPTTSELVKKLKDWKFSSYNDYVGNPHILQNVLTEISIKSSQSYKKFCEDRIDYQKRLKKIKKLLLE